jgi:hypothetical protein
MRNRFRKLKPSLRAIHIRTNKTETSKCNNVTGSESQEASGRVRKPHRVYGVLKECSAAPPSASKNSRGTWCRRPSVSSSPALGPIGIMLSCRQFPGLTKKKIPVNNSPDKESQNSKDLRSLVLFFFPIFLSEEAHKQNQQIEAKLEKRKGH